ncbi:MAG: glycosyltransferase family A protein, partial [Colwellia sp.]
MSSSDILVSVIIPTYGRPDKLSKAIDSVIQESVEVIVVDDNGSGTVNQELTSKSMSQYQGMSNVVYCLLPDNVGACKARNHGVSIAKSDIVAFLDDDDLCIANALIEKVKYFKGNERADFCCSNMLVRREGRNFRTHFSDFKGVEQKEYLISGNCYTPMVMA